MVLNTATFGPQMLTTREEYATYIAKHFRQFDLDMILCDPTNLNLSHEQLHLLMLEVQKNTPDFLSELTLLNITIQSAIQDEENAHPLDNISINIYSPFSTNAMIGFRTSIHKNTLSLVIIFQREKSEIRKLSLTPEIPRLETESTLFTGSLVILVVDDDLIIRNMLCKWFETLNSEFTVIKRTNAKDAVTYIQSGCPCDLIFMDIQMPELRGDLGCIMIREDEKNRGCHIPIVAMTATEIVPAHFERVGFDFALQKPLAPPLFNAVLSYIKSFSRYIKPNSAPNNIPGIEITRIDERVTLSSEETMMDWGQTTLLEHNHHKLYVFPFQPEHCHLFVTSFEKEIPLTNAPVTPQQHVPILPDALAEQQCEKEDNSSCDESLRY